MGLPSPITGSPHKEPEKPRAPRLRGFFFFCLCLSKAGTLRAHALLFAVPAPIFAAHALPPRHLEHQLGQAQARSGEPLRQGPPARPALPARDQMHRGQVSRARAPRARLSPYRRRRPEGLSRRRHALPPSLHARRAPRHLRARTCAPSLRHARRRDGAKPDRAAQCLRAGGRRHSRPRAQREVPPQARFPRGHGCLVRRPCAARPRTA